MTTKNSFKRIVVKVGTSLLTARDGRLDRARIKDISDQIGLLLDAGIEMLLVTSGAIGAGMGLLNIKARPQSLQRLQACAAVGQSKLMKIYDEAFRKNGYLTAQLLVTRDDLSDRRRYLNAKNTLSTLLQEKIVPIINENDTVSTEEIRFGDNDCLSSLVANLIRADLLVILTDVEGLCMTDSKTKEMGACVREVTKITDDIRRLAVKAKTRLGMGGMVSKIEAAKMCIDSNIPCIIANGRSKDILLRIIKGESVGTTFLPSKTRITARKHWIAYSSRVAGSIIVDEGAKDALAKRKKSLLASGIVGCEGSFDAARVVRIVSKDGSEFARGLTNYSSAEIEKIKGLKTDQIRSVLGYKYYDEVVNRDNLVML